MKLTRASGYGLYAMLYLAKQPSGQNLSAENISRDRELPRSFFGKVLQTLVRAGLLQSTRGTGGGFALGKSPEMISLLEVVEALQGPLQRAGCPVSGKECGESEGCTVNALWRAIDECEMDLLRERTLADLVQPNGPNCVEMAAFRASGASDAGGTA